MNESFVERDGSRLTLDGQNFRMSGTNIYWLGLDENVGGVDYPTYFRIKDALDTASQLGINVVRSHMVTSTSQADGNPLAIMPTLGSYNEDAFDTIDFAIAYAGTLGIRFILPITDEWSYYHGGHRDFTTPLELPDTDFYSNADAIAVYHDYIDTILARTNSITGVKYVDDPTILAWELGNELENMTLPWINQQVDYIKELAPRQLVAAGRRFDIDPDTLSATRLDIVDVHYYPPTAQRVSADAATIANAGKVYMAGEYASTAASDELLEAAAADPNVSGMFFWSLFGNNDRGGFVPHDDGFTLHYPGETPRAQESISAIQNYSAAVGSPGRTTISDPPLIAGIDKNFGINRVSWRGTAGAGSYIVERSVDGGAWRAVNQPGASASASPVTDFESPADARYRVVPISTSGARGPVSDVVEAPNDGATLVDPLQSWTLAASHTNARIVPTITGGVVVRESTGERASVSWQRNGIQSAEFIVSGGGAVVVETSSNGSVWAAAKTTAQTEGSQTTFNATGLSGNLVRVAWNSDIRVHRATIISLPERIALFDPLDDFSKTSDHQGSLSFDKGNPVVFGGDSSRVKRDSADASSITWTYEDISGADFDAWYWPDQPVVPLTIEQSADGGSWTQVDSGITGGTGNWKKYVYSVRQLTNANFIRVSWPTGAGEVWTPQIGSASIYSANVAELGKPAAFALTAPAADAQSITATPTFAWEPATDAAYYRFELSTSKNLKKPTVTTTGLSGTSYRPGVDLAPNEKYYWRVTAVNGKGETKSSTRSFSTAKLPTQILTIEDFESYSDDAAVNAAYTRNAGGGAISATLATGASTTSARFNYDLGTAGYAGVVRTITSPQNWWGFEGLSLSVDSSTANELAVQFVANGAFWEAPVTLSEGQQTVSIPFADFAPPAWAPAADLDLTSVTQYAFYLSGDAAIGAVTIDDITTVLASDTPTLPAATLKVSAPSGLVVAGDKIRIESSGLTAGERYRIRIGDTEVSSGKADKRGNLKESVRIPAKTGEGTATVSVLGATDKRFGSATIAVIQSRKELTATLTGPDVVSAKSTVTVSVTGLAKGEPVTVTYSGRVIPPRHVRADDTGQYEVTFSVGTATGKHRIKVTGATNQRSDSLTVRVEKAHR